MSHCISETKDCQPTEQRSDLSTVTPGSYAHLVIDVQRVFCDPTYAHLPVPGLRWLSDVFRRGTAKTDRLAGHIATVTDKVRRAGFPTYLAYMTGIFENAQVTKCSTETGTVGGGTGGFHKVRPTPGDIIVGKVKDSAFPHPWAIGNAPDIDRSLRENKVKGLLISGFNFTACVYATILDARRRGYEVVVLKDCVGNDFYASSLSTLLGRERIVTRYLKELGVKFISSDELLAAAKPGRSLAPAVA